MKPKFLRPTRQDGAKPCQLGLRNKCAFGNFIYYACAQKAVNAITAEAASKVDDVIIFERALIKT